MTIDLDAFAAQIARERARQRRAWLYGYLFVSVGMIIPLYGLATLMGYGGVTRTAGAIGGAFVFTALAALMLRLVGGAGELVTRGVLEPGGIARPPAITSHAEALAAKGDTAAAVAAFEAVRAEHGDTAAVLRREADLQLRGIDGQPGDLERARELLMRTRRAEDATAADELYATHRLIDLYLGPLRDEGKAMTELRRMADRFPGTPDAEGASQEWQRLRALMLDRHAQS